MRKSFSTPQGLSEHPRIACFRALNPEEVEQTIEALSRRISERFENSNLAKVCEELHAISTHAKEKALEIAQPLIVLRFCVGLFVFGIITATAYLSMRVGLPEKEFGLTELVQILDSALNDILIFAAATFSLMTLEARLKRQKAIRALHDLRGIAHIIDMHQLTKDPHRVMYPRRNTRSSPDEPLNAFELGRYLDYCSEMLALTGKIAAIYADHLHDETIFSAANDIESLTNSLARKIWQKLALLQSFQTEVVIAG